MTDQKQIDELAIAFVAGGVEPEIAWVLAEQEFQKRHHAEPNAPGCLVAFAVFIVVLFVLILA